MPFPALHRLLSSAAPSAKASLCSRQAGKPMICLTVARNDTYTYRTCTQQVKFPSLPLKTRYPSMNPSMKPRSCNGALRFFLSIPPRKRLRAGYRRLYTFRKRPAHSPAPFSSVNSYLNCLKGYASLLFEGTCLYIMSISITLVAQSSCTALPARCGENYILSYKKVMMIRKTDSCL